MGAHRRELDRAVALLPVVGVVLVVASLLTLRVVLAPDDADDASAATAAATTTTSPATDPTPSATPTPTSTAPTPDPLVDPTLQKQLREAIKAERQRQARRAERRAERLRNLPVTTDGPLGEVTAPRGSQVTDPVTVSVANIPNTRADAAWAGSVGALISSSPDFVTLNEVYKHPNEGIEAVAPGYTVHRAAAPDNTRGGGGQSMNNALLYREDTWTQVAGGMVKIVDDDQGFLRGKAFVWDRYAVWAILRNADGANVALISTHLPTNPQKFPAQHGNPGRSRIAMYGAAMDTLVSMVDQLSAYGPVLVGGDMNSHPNQGSWSAAAKFGAAGFEYTKDSGVMYLFFRGDAGVLAQRQIGIGSDHPALISTVDLSGAGPE